MRAVVEPEGHAAVELEPKNALTVKALAENLGVPEDTAQCGYHPINIVGGWPN